MPVLVYCRMTLEKNRVGLPPQAVESVCLLFCLFNSQFCNNIHRHTFVKLRTQSSSESEDGIYLSLTIDSLIVNSTNCFGCPRKAHCRKGLDSKASVLLSQCG